MFSFVVLEDVEKKMEKMYEYGKWFVMSGVWSKNQKVRNDGLNIFRRFFVNIYILSKYTKRTTKNKIDSNVRCLNIFQP